MSRPQDGFSLPDILLGLMLMNIILCALLQGQQAISRGFGEQWQQRERWQSLRQGLQGLPDNEHDIYRQPQPGLKGCHLYQPSLLWQQKNIRLEQLICGKPTPKKVNGDEASLPDLPSIYSD